jgi:thiosulfate reductase cytochrome b subunit
MAILSFTSGKEWMTMAGIGFGIYGIFFLLGFGFSYAATYHSCEKVNAYTSMKWGAAWSLFPTLAWFLVRPIELLRVQFDRFYLMFDNTPERAGWISVGYVMMLACVAGIYYLVNGSVKAVCIPSMDEATKFKQDMLEAKAEKDAAVKSAQESTPAVTPV